jgi:AcrR family transcriptional regulator
MPKALTEKEKCAQCQKLLSKGKDVVMASGIRKVSVDDIVKAAGMAKGTFYQHFDSKESYLYALIEAIHEEAFAKAGQMIASALMGGSDLRGSARDFLGKLLQMPEMVFFIQNEAAIIALFETIPNQELLSSRQTETHLFEKILLLAGIDTGTVKPGVVHNCVHALFLMLGSDLMIKHDLQETADLLIDSLISYIFGGTI